MNHAAHILTILLVIALGGCADAVAPKVTLAPDTTAPPHIAQPTVVGYLVSHHGTATIQGPLNEAIYQASNEAGNHESQPLLVNALPLDASVSGIETLY